MRHKEPPYHELRAETIALKSALAKYNDEIAGYVTLDAWDDIVADLSFLPQKERYVGDIAGVLATLREANSTAEAELLFSQTDGFVSRPFRDRTRKQ